MNALCPWSARSASTHSARSRTLRGAACAGQPSFFRPCASSPNFSQAAPSALRHSFQCRSAAARLCPGWKRPPEPAMPRPWFRDTRRRHNPARAKNRDSIRHPHTGGRAENWRPFSIRRYGSPPRAGVFLPYSSARIARAVGVTQAAVPGNQGQPGFCSPRLAPSRRSRS